MEIKRIKPTIIIAAFIPNTLQNPLLFDADLFGFFVDVEVIFKKFYLNNNIPMITIKKFLDNCFEIQSS